MKAVVFDLFGTLVLPWPTTWTHQFNEMIAAELGVELDAVRHAWHTDFDARMTGPLAASYLRVCERLGKPPLPSPFVEALDARRVAVTLECLAAPREGSVDLLTQLAGDGIGLGLISDCSSEVPAVWARSPLAAHIHHPVFSAAVGLKKPDPRIFALACERLGVPPDRTLYVGDGGSEELPGARSVGMRAVLFAPGDTTEPQWDGPRIRSLPEVAGLLDRAGDQRAAGVRGRMAR